MMTAVFILIGLGIILALIQLIKGPGSIDRIISLDTVNMECVGLIAVLALFFKNGLLFDIAIVYAVLAFLETIVFARFMEGKSC